jgi:hypothetical protein
MERKNANSVPLKRKSATKGGPSHTERGLNGELMSAKTNIATHAEASARNIDTSDGALLALLSRLKVTADPAEIRKLSDDIERIVFHKQFTNG